MSETPTRSVWLAPTYDFLASSAFEPSSRHGFGASAAYEFHISPRFNLGLTLAYRLYPGEQATQQVGYGATLKHFFSSHWATVDGLYPFVDYGLLMQQSFVGGRSGSGVSHDTRLGGGAVFRSAPISLYADVGAHYSRLDFFEVESTWIPYLDVRSAGFSPSSSRTQYPLALFAVQAHRDGRRQKDDERRRDQHPRHVRRRGLSVHQVAGRAREERDRVLADDRLEPAGHRL